MVAEPLSPRIEAQEEEPDSTSPALRRLRSVLPQGFQRHIRSARDLDREFREERAADHEAALPTAVPALDRLLDGGLPRGQLMELVGSRTSGRFSTVLATLAAATGVGEVAALIDLGDGLDPAAAEAMGVDLHRLLWLRPINLKQALAAAEMVLASGFPLVVLDLGSPPIRGGRGLEAAWLRIARAARAHGAALLVSSPYRVSGTAAGVVLKAERARAAWNGEENATPLLNGAAARLQIEKHRGRLPGQAEEMKLRLALTPRPPLPMHPNTPSPGEGETISEGLLPPRPGRVGWADRERGVRGGEGLRVAGGRR
jgi:RecA DNA recombination protein